MVPLCQDLAGCPEQAVPLFLEDSVFTYEVAIITSALPTALFAMKVDPVNSNNAESSK